jgi:hypothetical protein
MEFIDSSFFNSRHLFIDDAINFENLKSKTKIYNYIDKIFEIADEDNNYFLE